MSSFALYAPSLQKEDYEDNHEGVEYLFLVRAPYFSYRKDEKLILVASCDKCLVGCSILAA